MTKRKRLDQNHQFLLRAIGMAEEKYSLALERLEKVEFRRRNRTKFSLRIAKMDARTALRNLRSLKKELAMFEAIVKRNREK